MYKGEFIDKIDRISETSRHYNGKIKKYRKFSV